MDPFHPPNPQKRAFPALNSDSPNSTSSNGSSTSSSAAPLYPFQPIASTSNLPPQNTLSHPNENGHGTNGAEAPAPKKKRVLPPGPPPPPGAIITEKSCARCRARKGANLRCSSCSGMSTKEAERFARLEQRLAELEAQVTVQNTHDLHPTFDILRPHPPPAAPPSQALTSFLASLPESPETEPVPNIGQDSLDWRLATPQMARSLSQHLCDAFFESCCFLLPAFTYFRSRLPDYRADPAQLDAQEKISIAVFCAVGARASPHSALLGIAASPDDSRDHPQAPLLSAGERRQNACSVLLSKAHTLCFEQGVEDEATEENLAALLALMQMSIFVELKPKKSRSLLRAALGHFKDLQDMAATAEEKMALKKSFALAIYHGDSLTSPAARKACLISDDDLRRYFDHIGIVVPNLPEMELTPVLISLFNGKDATHSSLKTASHLLMCWTCACQRMFARLVTPANRTLAELSVAIPALWSAIDGTRAAIQHLENVIFNSGTELSAPHTHGPEQHGHIHESDYLSQAIRLDRDLLDLNSMLHSVLLAAAAPGLPTLLSESTSRVRKGLKTQAFYCKIYLTGVVFQLEHNPKWTEMALQRVGEPGGPHDDTEAVSDVELTWFIEGLQHACFYTPSAEPRLAELSPRFQQLDPPQALPSPPPPAGQSPYADYLANELSAIPPTPPSLSFDNLFTGFGGQGQGGDSSLAYDYEQFSSTFFPLNETGGV
ncbi:hypothetical protein P7C70_g3383, partial [Phenoliferia sp. Uapishka_3]